MGVLEAIVLGVVQGLTEFLPISSSGHLVLASYWLGLRTEGASLELAVTIATNTGTFLAVLVALWRDVIAAVTGFARGLVSPAARSEPGWRMAWLVIIGSVPTAVIGLGLRGGFERLNAPLPASIALVVTGVILWTAPRNGRRVGPNQLGWRDALFMGFAQGLAVVPGISRSGTTIASLLWRDVDAATAARLSFLLYLVASAGVAAIGVAEVSEAAISWRAVAWMTLASFVTGWLALLWLFRLLARGAFRWFAPYLWLVAGVTLVRVLSG